MPTTQHHRRHAPLPVPEVADSSFGEFEAATSARDSGHARAERLLADARALHTIHGYTAHAELVATLERLVHALCAEVAATGAAR